MIMDADIETGGGCHQPAGRLAVGVARCRIAGRMVVDDYQGRRSDFQCAAQDGARVQDHGSDRPARRLFIAQQVVPRVEIQDMQAFIQLMRKAPVQIVDDRTGRGQDGPLGQGKPQNVKLGGTHAGQQFRHPTIFDHLGDRLCRCRQNARQRFEAREQRCRPDLAQSCVDRFEERRQDGSAPEVLSRARCHAVAAASSTSMG